MLEKHSEKELIENVLHAIKVVASKVPGTWKNIQSFLVKTSSTVSLPVYQSLPTVLPPAFQTNGKAGAKQRQKQNRKRKLSENKKTDESKENSNPMKEVVDNDEISQDDAFNEPRAKKKVKKVQKKVKNKKGKKES